MFRRPHVVLSWQLIRRCWVFIFVWNSTPGTVFFEVGKSQNVRGVIETFSNEPVILSGSGTLLKISDERDVFEVASSAYAIPSNLLAFEITLSQFFFHNQNQFVCDNVLSGPGFLVSPILILRKLMGFSVN